MNWLTVILPAIVAAVAALSDVIQPYIAANPTLTVVVGAVAAIIAALTRSPLKPS